MENQKATESAGSSNGEIHERANSKTEKTHQKITLPTFENAEYRRQSFGGDDSHNTSK